jgi:hypothetical protein
MVFTVPSDGALAEIKDLRRVGLHRQRDRFQLLGGVGQSRQKTQFGAVDAIELRAVAPLQRHAARDVAASIRDLGGGSLLFRLRLLVLVEIGIAEADELFAIGLARRQLPQRAQRCGGGDRRHGMGLRQPGHVAIAREQRIIVLLGLGGRSGQQRYRQQAECAVGHDHQILGRLPAALDGPQEQLVEAVGQLQIERRNIRDHRGLRLERLAQLADLALDLSAFRRDLGKGDRPLLGNGPDEAGRVRQHGANYGERSIRTSSIISSWIGALCCPRVPSVRPQHSMWRSPRKQS